MAELSVRHVTQCLGGARVLDDVSLDVADGEIACLLGPSGAGKTTLFHIIAGLSSPDEGTVLLDGRDVTGMSGQVGYMLQKDLLLAHKTVLDNIALPLVLKGVPKREARTEAEELLGTFGLEGTGGRWPTELSGGMRQRAALARAWLFNRDFLLLDEPFSALDAFTRAEMHEWFLGVSSELGTSALIVTHDADEAVALADVIFAMRGKPQQGVPSRIAGSVRVGAAERERGDFRTSSAFLERKREVLELLA